MKIKHRTLYINFIIIFMGKRTKRITNLTKFSNDMNYKHGNKNIRFGFQSFFPKSSSLNIILNRILKIISVSVLNYLELSGEDIKKKKKLE